MILASQFLNLETGFMVVEIFERYIIGVAIDRLNQRYWEVGDQKGPWWLVYTHTTVVLEF